MAGRRGENKKVRSYQERGKRTQVHDPIAASEEQYRILFDCNPNPMWVYDPETLRFLAVNDAAIYHYGYSRDEFLSMTIRDIRPPEDIARLDDNLRLPVVTPIDDPGIWRHRTKDGKVSYVHVTSHEVPFGGRKGKLVLAQNLTSQLEAEERLSRALEMERQSREEVDKINNRLAFLLEASTTLSESFDYQERLKAVAKLAAPRIADWCAVDILEQDGTLARLAVVHSHPRMVEYAFELQKRYPYRPGASSGLSKVLRTGQAEIINDIPDELLLATARNDDDLEIFRMLGLRAVMIVPLVAFGRTLGAITLVYSESERKFTEEDRILAEDLARRAAMQIDHARLYRETQELNASLEKKVDERTSELQAANRELEAFSYSVSHDLRAPLRHIHGFTDLLTRHTENTMDEKGKRYLGLISNSVKEMGALIDDLLMFSRMGRIEMRKATVDPRDTVESVINSMSQETGGREIEWKISPLPVVEVDRNMLRLVFQNLLGNAVKYTRPREKAVIEVEGTVNDDEAIICVRDNGVGFDMKYSDNLFGVFQRLHSSEEFEGTGIGLANVRRIIQRHGGKTWAEGEVNKGAAIYFSLPVSKKG